MHATPRVAIATSTTAGAHDVDMPYLCAAIERRGLAAEAVVWDADCDWGAFDLVLIRSTWDYPWRITEFAAWVDKVADQTRLANSAEVVRWNLDKRYLRDLARADVRVASTSYLEPGNEIALPAGNIVVKPVISSGARNAARYRPHEHTEAFEHIRMLHDSGVTVMIQPYIPEIDLHGEHALVFFGGVFSHAINKGPVLTASGIDNKRFPHPDLAKYEPTPDEVAAAAAALDAIGHPLAQVPYARIDMVPGADSTPIIMEVELVEPNLFLTWSEGAPDRFADVIAEYCT